MRTLPQVTGSTENALRALLTEQLAGSRVPDYLAWACLNLATGAASRESLEGSLDRATRCGPEVAGATVERLITAGLLDGAGTPTADGAAELAAVRRRVQAITAELVAGVDEHEIGRAIEVLEQVRERAEALLRDRTPGEAAPEG